MDQDNQIINIILIAIALLLLMAIAIVLFFYFSRRRIVKTQLEKANLIIEHQKDLLQATIITQEEERRRIAQDMHDAISSKLNIVSLNANFLMDETITIDEVNKMGNSILNVTTTVLESSRRIAHDLLPPTLDKFGLVAALEELCEEVSEAKMFEIDYRVAYEDNTLQKDQELHFFRIVQELFTNSIKYAEATKIELSLEESDDILILRYTDDGKGFDISKIKIAKGLGMSGIENRALLLDTELKIKSARGEGMQVYIEKRLIK